MIISESVPIGTRIFGFDTFSKLDDMHADNLAALFAFGVRYVNLTEEASDAALDAAELDRLLRRHLGVLTVQFARTSAWSMATGYADGAAAARNHLALGLPPNSTLSCDLEGGFASAQQCIDYGGAWYDMAVSRGMDPDSLQVYVGSGVPLTSEQLYKSLPFRGYWKSGSDVPDVSRRGYRMIQLRPLDQVVAAVRVDLDVIQTDCLGSRPRWARLA